MNITVNDKKRLEKVYPYIGQIDSNDTGLLVLFISCTSGIVLRTGQPHPGTGWNVYEVGAFRDDWLQDYFKPFNDAVTISN